MKIWKIVTIYLLKSEIWFDSNFGWFFVNPKKLHVLYTRIEENKEKVEKIKESLKK